MRQIREVLRLKYACRLSRRDISASAGISLTSVGDYLARATLAGLTWAEAEPLSDAEVERRLFHRIESNTPAARVAIDFAWVHRELHRDGVTLLQLWTEYRAAHSSPPRAPTARAPASDGGALPYQYSQFCDLYAAFRSKLSVVMRQVHRAGERAFVDYSGKKPTYVDPATGEVLAAELFVMVLGASNYTYVEATRSQQLPDFIGSHVRALDYYGCVPEIVVPDQLRSAVSGPHRYDPEINPTYAELSKHYGFAVIPARPRKPRDKAKVEAGVLLAQRWILACLRNQTFFGLDALNAAIAELLERLNTRPFQKLEGCRRSAFEAIDRPAMKPLPKSRYVLATWKRARVNIDYHFEYDARLYSVDHTLVGAEIEVRATSGTIEALHGGERVTSHRRCYGPKGTATTRQEHRPKSHRDYGAWPPSRMVSWAASIGPETAKLVEQILASRPHPERGYRTCQALFRESKKYGNARTEAACARAIAIGSPTRKSVAMILKRGLDRVPVVGAAPDPQTSLPITHEHVRGGDYFDTALRASRDEPGDPPDDDTGTLH